MHSRVEASMYAFRGGWTLLATQRHAKVHALATVLVMTAGYAFRISTVEWALLVVATAIVWMAEALNTAIEFLADEVSLEQRERIKHAKDVAAFAVLARMFHEEDFAGSFLLRWLHFVDLAQV